MKWVECKYKVKIPPRDLWWRFLFSLGNQDIFPFVMCEPLFDVKKVPKP